MGAEKNRHTVTHAGIPNFFFTVVFSGKEGCYWVRTVPLEWVAPELITLKPAADSLV
jgi:hypothetical protein